MLHNKRITKGFPLKYKIGDENRNSNVGFSKFEICFLLRISIDIFFSKIRYLKEKNLILSAHLNYNNYVFYSEICYFIVVKFKNFIQRHLGGNSGITIK